MYVYCTVLCVLTGEIEWKHCWCYHYCLTRHCCEWAKNSRSQYKRIKTYFSVKSLNDLWHTTGIIEKGTVLYYAGTKKEELSAICHRLSLLWVRCNWWVPTSRLCFLPSGETWSDNVSQQPVSPEILCNKFGLLEWPVLEGSGPLGPGRMGSSIFQFGGAFWARFIHSCPRWSLP